MRNVTELSKRNGKVYVYLRDEVIARRFLQDAKDEGFTFGDGEKPTARPGNDLYVVNRDWTISHTLQVCLDSGAKKILIPAVCMPELATVPADLSTAFDFILFKSPEETVMKALGAN